MIKNNKEKIYIFIICFLFLFFIYLGIVSIPVKVFYENSFLFFDSFSIIHLVIGATFMLGLIIINPQNKWYCLLIMLVLWEIYEGLTLAPLFSVNNAWDIVIGLAGGA